MVASPGKSFLGEKFQQAAKDFGAVKRVTGENPIHLFPYPVRIHSCFGKRSWRGLGISALNLETKATVSVLTDDGGNFAAPILPPGNYSVVVESPGFKRAVREPVTLLVDQRQHLDFTLELGQVTENVNVQAEVSQVPADTATVGTAVTATQTSELPLNGRNFLQLDLLVPGAQPTVKGSNLSGEGGSIEVHSLRENSNYFWIDRMDNETQSIGELVVNPPQYSIEEFRVMSPTYGAEFGRTAGAQINVILRSGGNDHHGDVYLLIRNSVLDAKNFFDPAGRIPAFRRGQYGADFGGKLKRDRTFFYVAWDGQTYAQGESASAIVPTPAEVQGNFSALSTVIKDPTTGLPFSGNIIPTSRINQIGANIASYFPAPNSGTDTLVVSPTGTDSDNVAILKIDQILSSKDHLTGRVTFGDAFIGPGRRGRVQPGTASRELHAAVLLGVAGRMRSMPMPRRSHQTESLERLNRPLGEAKGTPLSERMACGSPVLGG